MDRDATGAAPKQRGTDGPDADGLPARANEDAAFEARVVRAFVRDGRLVSIPARDRKRRVILRWIVDACSGEDRRYPEKEVNMRLALIHPDVAALRRYLVEAGLMTRASGEYRRTVQPAPASAPGIAGEPDGSSETSEAS